MTERTFSREGLPETWLRPCICDLCRRSNFIGSPILREQGSYVCVCEKYVQSSHSVVLLLLSKKQIDVTFPLFCCGEASQLFPLSFILCCVTEVKPDGLLC